MSVIVTQGLTKRYGRRIGIERLSLSVPEANLFGFLGPNGAGKTTTIRLLLGLLKPDEGDARIFRLNCWRDSHRIKSEVGYLPGDLHLYPWLTCTIALRIFGGTRGRDLTAVGGAVAQDFELDPNVPVRAMSRGMRQKLGIVLALAHRPRLLVLDEPTASLDPLMQIKLYEHLRELASAGHTVLFSSHTLSEVEQLCDRVAILRRGRLVADEALDDLRARARRSVTIRWKKATGPKDSSPPPFLDVHEYRDMEWHASLTGPVMELVRWSARQPIEDLTIARPDLSTLFRQYYQNEEPEA